MTAAVFLDRDNTLILNDGDLGDPDQVRLVQGAASAIASLCGLGYRVVVVSNQGGVARGKYTEDDVRAVHQRIRERVEQGANGARIDAFYFCPYHPQAKVSRYREADHEDRKPRPGMLLKAAGDHGLDLRQSWMVGDQLRDIQAGAAAGTRTVWLRPGASRPGPTATGASRSGMVEESEGGVGDGPTQPEVAADFEARNLVEAVRLIAQSRKPESGEELSRMQASGKRWDSAAVARLQHPRANPKAANEPGEAGQPGASTQRSQQPEAPGEATEPKRRGGAGGDGDAGGDDARGDKAGGDKAWSPTVSSEQAPAEPASARGGDAGGASGKSGVAEPCGKPPAPFRPWNAPPPSPPEKELPQSKATSPPEEAAQAASASAREGARGQAGERAPNEAKPEGHAPPPPPDAPPETTPEASADPSSDRLLRLILQELRQQRGSGGGDDFAMAKVVAMVLQTIAGVCLLGGLWMGAGDPVLFLKWIGAGLMIQMATIAVLLFTR